MKKISIILLIFMFLTFLGFETFKTASYEVLEVVSPVEIIVDLNANGVKNEDETILLESVQSFSTKPDEAQKQLTQKLKISEENSIGLGFLAENFAKETLLGKKVKLDEKPNCLAFRPLGEKVAERRMRGNPPLLYINNKNYEKMLVDEGFAIDKTEKITPQIQKNLQKLPKLHLVIFNNKSHKYHKLNCKYGKLAHNSQILPVFQLPKDAKACKFCSVKRAKSEKEKEKEKRFWADNDIIPNIPRPPMVFQSGITKIFLTDLTSVLKPSNACTTEVCRALVNQIDNAQNSIDFAIYGYTKIPALQKALEKAQNRGVKIRFVSDIDCKNENLYPDTLYLTTVFNKNNADFGNNAIMHNKFFVFDYKTVFAGSANISNTDMSGFNSNAVVLINSPEIASVYSQEFEQMYYGKFHKQKLKIVKNEPVFEDISVYFSPQDKIITTQIIPLIDGAQKYVYMPVFLITHKGLIDSLIAASHRGVAVKIILDATNAHGIVGKQKILRENGIPVKTENFAGKLHSKSIIIDDLYTVIGSMNFSKSGETINDENLMIIKNREIALFYKSFFQYLWKRIPDKWLRLNARAESPDSVGSCSDGIDNDFDDKIDKADDSCTPYQMKAKRK